MDTLEPVQIQRPEWKRPNIGYIDHNRPIIMINGREHYPIHWDNPGYADEYIDISYVQKMEDVLKFKHNWHPPGEVPVSPKQCKLAAFRREQALKQVHKSRASQNTAQRIQFHVTEDCQRRCYIADK